MITRKTGKISSIFIGNELFIADRGHTGVTDGYVEVGHWTILVPTLDCPIVVSKDGDRGEYLYVGVAVVVRPWKEIDILDGR